MVEQTNTIEQTNTNPETVAAQNDADRGESTIQRLKRRGVLVAAWAAVAGVVAKQTTQPVFAGTDGDVVLGTSNASNAMTTISYTGSAVVKAALVCEHSAAPGGTGLWAAGSLAGVVGQQIGSKAFHPGNAGVLGYAEAADTPGVMGQHNFAVGVLGDCYYGTGVNGRRY